MNTLMMPQVSKIVQALKPAADAGGRTGVYVSLKGYEEAYLVVSIDQGNAATIALTPYQAQDVSATGEKVLGNVPIWADQDCAASDLLVRQTDAANFTTSAAVKQKVVVFKIAAAALDVANGFKAVVIKTGASNAANITSAMWLLVGARYAQEGPPSAIVN
jgi:hypothetical protein